MRLFVAGATGATGTVFIPLAEQAGHELRLHVRPQSRDKSPLGRDPRARVVDLADEGALREAVAGCDAVVSFVGTMRNRFSAGDTYESSDVGSTRHLVAAAKSAGVSRVLLLSSFGAGGAGAYLQMKAECERIVTDSGLAWAIFRPSMLVSPEGSTTSVHGARRAPPGATSAMRIMRAIPGLRGWADDARPIGIDVVCRAFLAVLAGWEKWQGNVLSGRTLWELGSPAP